MKKLIIALSIASTTALSGCTTFDPYTGEQKTTNTAKGAGIGAGAAMVLSYLTNKDKSASERKRRLLRDAGIGTIAGGGTGYYMDNQEGKLRKQLRNSGVSGVRDGDNINLVMPGNITFPSNGSQLMSNFYNVLDSVALVLEEFEKTIIVVAGYTDSNGSEAYNQQLSENRAKNVAFHLMDNGISRDRIVTYGYGEERPIAANTTAEGKRMNRRVTFLISEI